MALISSSCLTDLSINGDDSILGLTGCVPSLLILSQHTVCLLCATQRGGQRCSLTTFKVVKLEQITTVFAAALSENVCAISSLYLVLIYTNIIFLISAD